MSKKLNAYLVCCEPRVVLFGYATVEEIEKEHPTLGKARMLVYWSSKTRGLLGCASKGPQEGSRISDPVSELKIRTKVECHIPCSKEAVKIFESGLWSE